MRTVLRALIFILLAGGTPTGLAAPPERPVSTTLRMPATFPVVGYGLTNAFGSLAFDQPVSIATIPGETNRIFIVEKTGRIMVVTNLVAPTKTEFLDATEGLVANSEGGLLGLAFHPGYRTNGLFYIYRTMGTSLDGVYNGYYNEVARYRVDPGNLDRALEGSRQRVWLQYDANPGQHNGGDICFGPDGYLYVSVGDDGPAASEGPKPDQAIDQHFFGGILRLDVDGRPGNLPPNPYATGVANYLIPADNPFIGRTSFNGRAVNPAKVRTELYAVGLRNPWRITFDGDVLYCGDVGSGAIEEVNVIRPGRNYGWPYFEGKQAQGLPVPADLNMVPPAYSYSRGSEMTSGYCIVGGVVYRGGALPDFQGHYVFGDFVGGSVWAMDLSNPSVERPTSVANVPNLTTFGIDPSNGDVLAASLDGIVFRLIYVEPESTAAPLTLAETGAFSDLKTLAPAHGLIPYEVAVPFWSDGAIKQRWFALPDAPAQFGFAAQTNWAFPSGSVWVKHFELEMTRGVPASRRRLETRLLVKNEQGVYGVTYRWGESISDALLVPEGGMEERLTVREKGKSRTQTWIYPSRSACLKCHNAGAGHVLGFNTPQMNCEVETEGGRTNQLQLLHGKGYLAGTLPDLSTLPALVDPYDRKAPLEHRVRSLLQANCSQCHYPGGPTAAKWDARITTPFSEASILDVDSVSLPWLQIIKGGRPEDSLMLKRLSQDFARMPPLGTTELDRQAIALITEYAQTSLTAPWEHLDVGSTGREGSASRSRGVYRVNGGGTNLAGRTDSFHFVYQPLRGNGQIVARLGTSSSAQARAGILIRSSTRGDASFALLSRKGAQMELSHRNSDGVDVVPSAWHGSPQWMRLVREGSSVQASTSADGKVWKHAGSTPFEAAEDVLIGLAVCSATNGRLATAEFDRVSVGGVRLASPADGATLGLPGGMELRAEVMADGMKVARVEFYAGDRLLGQVRRHPYTMTWSNAIAGEHVLRAQVYGETGASFFSAPINVHVDVPTARASVLATDLRRQGNWRPGMGRDGFILAGIATNLPSAIEFGMSEVETRDWAARSTDRRAVKRPGSTARSAAAWVSAASTEATLTFRDGALHRVSLYFLDWDRAGRSQFVEIFDASSGTLLAVTPVSDFGGGVWFSVAVRGSVRIRVTRTSGPDALLSGIFVDPLPNPLPTVEILSPRPQHEIVLGRETIIEADAHDEDGIESVAFFANGDPIGMVRERPFQVDWRPASDGLFAIAARATDSLGQYRDATVKIEVTSSAASARLVRVDSTTQGQWIGTYGADGFAIPGYATNYPGYVHVSLLAASERVYFVEGTPRELRRPDGDEGILSVWTVDGPVDLKFNDGSNHVLAVYFMDPERGRQQRVTISDGKTGAPLSKVDLLTFGDGKYVVWNVRGHIRLELTNLLGSFTYISGLFFDTPAAAMPSTITGARVFHDLEQGLALEIRKRKEQAMPEIQESTDLSDWRVLTETLEEIGRVEEGDHEIIVLRLSGSATGKTSHGFYRVVFR